MLVALKRLKKWSNCRTLLRPGYRVTKGCVVLWSTWHWKDTTCTYRISSHRMHLHSCLWFWIAANVHWRRFRYGLRVVPYGSRARTIHHFYEVQRTMLELLNQLNSFEATKNIKVNMGTNWVDILDPALLHLGRIDRKIEFPPRNEEIRLKNSLTLNELQAWYEPM